VTADPRRPLPPPAFQDDDGRPDPRVAAALEAFDCGEGGAADVLAALAAGRLLVPVVAVLDEMSDGVEKASHMATVTTIGRDGRKGLLAFTCTQAMARWNPEARPAPVPTRTAAEVALSERADALVIDLAGPVVFTVDAPDLRSLASGWRPLEVWTGYDEIDAPSADGSPVARQRGLGALAERAWRLLRSRPAR
jgi:hypothetical protein